MKINRLILYSPLILIAGLAGFILGALILGDYSPNMLLELISGETPQAKITHYLQAIKAQDRAAAMDAWTLPPDKAGTFAPLSERRSRVTDDLLRREITQFAVFEPQWWGTCCEPGVTRHARNAGGARVQVQVVDANGRTWTYTFDVFTDGAYFADAIGNPYRHWFLRDVYPDGETPIYWKLVSTQILAPAFDAYPAPVTTLIPFLTPVHEVTSTPTSVLLSNGWYLYTDPEGEFSFSYPPDSIFGAGQNKSDLSKNISLQFLLPDTNGFQGMSIRIEPNPDALTNEEFVGRLYERFSSKPAPTDFSGFFKAKDVVVDGIQAFQVTIPGSNTELTIVFQAKEKVFIISPMHDEVVVNVDPKALALFFQVLETFKITK